MVPDPNLVVEETTEDAYWPTRQPGQVPVLILGSYHMDDPGLDQVNVDVDDVLSDRRQAELRDLADRLEDWNPDVVAVERPHDAADELNDVYDRYRHGEYAYDTEYEYESTHGKRNDPTAECRSEIVQVGFRVADRRGLDRVHPVDRPAMLGDGEAAAELRDRGFEPAQKVDVPRLDTDALQAETDERLAESTVPEYYRWLNREANLRKNHYGMFGQFVTYGTGDNFAGPEMLGTWYERNAAMVHNVWRALDSEQGEDPERVLFVVGSGHVRVLRRLFAEAPQFCPVSPLPALRG